MIGVRSPFKTDHRVDMRSKLGRKSGKSSLLPAAANLAPPSEELRHTTANSRFTKGTVGGGWSSELFIVDPKDNLPWPCDGRIVRESLGRRRPCGRGRCCREEMAHHRLA